MIKEPWEEDFLKNFKKDKTKRRCPSCGSLALIFDESKLRIHCTECGFEEYLPKMR